MSSSEGRMGLRETVARFIGEERYRDAFYDASITEQDRETCRGIADGILRLVMEVVEGMPASRPPFWADKESSDLYELGAKADRDAIVQRLKEGK